MDLTDRVSYKKWEFTFDNDYQIVKNLDYNKNKQFNLVLMYYPLDMEECIQPMNGWSESKGKQDIIKLLGIICSICHKHENTKQGTLSHIKTDIVIFTMCKKVHEFPA